MDEAGGLLKPLYESRDGSVLDQPDNIMVSPKAAILMCEDRNGEDVDGGDNWLRVLTPQGENFDFAHNLKPIDLNTIDDEEFPDPAQPSAPASFLPCASARMADGYA